MARPRLRYTHKLTIYNNTNSIFSGAVASSMTPSATQPAVGFKIEATTDNTSTITGLKITGLVNGSTKVENLTFDTAETKYSETEFNSITSLVSKSFRAGTTIQINAVDSAYQPIYWQGEYGPYKCTFSTVDGMASGVQPEPIGLRTVLSHYVRLPISAPVYKNMEFEIEPIGLSSRMYNPYDGVRYVPTTDFDIVCIPPKYIPVEWAFRATEKTDD